jgi:hypothetical protein
MHRLSAAGLMALVLGVAQPSTAHAQQSVNFYLGGFTPFGEDARVRDNGFSNDVLVNNLDYLSFRLSDFNGATVGAEYLVGLGPFLDAGLGVGAYNRTVPTQYIDFEDASGFSIEQDLKLRIIPFSATIRVLPLGRSNGIVPYIGAGLGVFNWRYSESGSFVDFSDFHIFRDSFVAKGSATGPVVLGGLRFPVGGVDLGGEVRYQKATGDLPLEQSFTADKIDLGGWSYLLTLNVRF